MSNKRINLDNASTTPTDSRVLEVLDYHLKNTKGNASSITKEGVAAKKVLTECRQKVARCLNAHADEIIFTSGGTESNNSAIFGLCSQFSVLGSQRKKIHAITTVIEHSSVLECFRELETRGVEVTYLPVDPGGIVDLTKLKTALRPETVLVSIQYANNEIGVIQPIREISKLIRGFRLSRSSLIPIFHSDASQGAAYLGLSVERLGVDLLTLDGHKIYGPKGIGALFIRRGVTVNPLFSGGGQENGLRPGTENVPAIAAFTEALELCANDKTKEPGRLIKMRDALIKELVRLGNGRVVLNGDAKMRLPNNVNVSILDCDTEYLTLQLDAEGFCVSTKSACLNKEEGSYVVGATGCEDWRAKHTLRISLGRFTKTADLKRFTKVFGALLKKPSAYVSNIKHQKFI